jgi:formylglycine-generating enzyme required for sulfatase activity
MREDKHMSMSIRRWLAGAAMVAGLLSVPALAQTFDRLAAFEAWQAANPDMEEQIANLKVRTAEAIADHRRREADEDKARREAMRKRWEELADIQKERVRVLVEDADALALEDRCGDAVNRYGQALAIDPASVAANTGMGKCLGSEGKLRRAATFLTRAIESPAHDAPSRQGKLMAMMALQDLPPPPDPAVNDPPAIFRIEGAPGEVWDAPEAPVMVIIPAGEYTMGAPADEQYYQGRENQHRVTIAYPLAVSKYNVTRGEFAAFVAETGYDEKGCDIWENGTFKWDPEGDWSRPGFEQDDDDAVGCITWYDAKAYAGWLSEKTGHRYRLPSEAELEYAVRAGTTTAYYWGNDVGIGNANCDGCDGPDHQMKSTPGGKFSPNAFGLYDMVGNVWKWMEDCWNPNYDGAPTDGSPWLSGNCSLRGKRTGSWFNLDAPRPNDPRAPGRLRSADRFGSMPDLRIVSFGFRVVREL